MAIVYRVVQGVRENSGTDDEVLVIPMPTEGHVRGALRLWNEQPSPPAPPGVPLSATDLYVVIGDDIGPTSGPVGQRYGQAVKLGDIQRLEGGWQKLLSDRGYTIDRWTDPTTSFGGDLALPASLIAGYVV